MWTTLKNNVFPQTPVMSAEKNGNTVLPVTYNVTDEQVQMLNKFYSSSA